MTHDSNQAFACECGCIPIEIATLRRDIEMIKALASWAVNPNESNSEYTPIDRRAFNGDVEIVKFWPPRWSIQMNQSQI